MFGETATASGLAEAALQQESGASHSRCSLLPTRQHPLVSLRYDSLLPPARSSHTHERALSLTCGHSACSPPRRRHLLV
eukprot:6177347-Pleurochrysis_carterae.AAC.2